MPDVLIDSLVWLHGIGGDAGFPSSHSAGIQWFAEPWGQTVLRTSPSRVTLLQKDTRRVVLRRRMGKASLHPVLARKQYRSVLSAALNHKH